MVCVSEYLLKQGSRIPNSYKNKLRMIKNDLKFWQVFTHNRNAGCFICYMYFSSAKPGFLSKFVEPSTILRSSDKRCVFGTYS